MLESLASVFIVFGGILLSLFLFHKKRRKSEPFVCPLHGKCSEVIHSDYSKFLGLPVEIIGLVYYALVALVHGLVIGFPGSLDWFGLPLLIASTAALLFSLYLTFIQIVAFALVPISIVSWYSAFILGSLPATNTFFFWVFLKVYLLLSVVGMTIGQFVENRLSHRVVSWSTSRYV